MAAQAVFAVPELFDSILGDVESRELLINQRVCRQWCTFIRRSRALNKRMSLLPGRTTHDTSRVELNPYVSQVVNLAHASFAVQNTNSWLRPGASWRRMLLLRPTLAGRRLFVHIFYRKFPYTVRGFRDFFKLIECVDGSGMWTSITMEGFLNAVEKLIKEAKIEVQDLVDVKVMADTEKDGNPRAELARVDIEHPLVTIS